MNSKQRVLNTIDHKSVDRIPTDLSANRFVRENLMHWLKLNNHIDLLNYYKSDIVDLRDCVMPEYIGPGQLTIQMDNGITENFWGWRTRIMETPRGMEEQFCEFKLQQAKSIEDLEKYNWPNSDWFDFSEFKSQLESYKDFCVMASGGSVFQHPTFLRGMDTFLMDLIMNPDMAKFLMDKFTDFYLAYFERMFESAKGEIDIFRVADDVAMQTGLLISKEMFDEFVAQRLKKLIDLAHRYNIKFMLHSCGDVSQLIPRFIELGVDILDPIQVSATNMNVFDIHKKFGHLICLHGGIDTQQFLPNASTRDIKEKISDTINYFKNQSGYILSTSHVIEGDIPLENIDALFNEVYNYY